MTKPETAKKTHSLTETAGKVFSGIISIFLVIILAVFPLYFHNYYFDILVAKYRFYWLTVVIMLAVCLIAGLVFFVRDRGECGGENAKRFFQSFSLENVKRLPAAYKFLLVFWLLTVVSTLLSDYRYESFWGNEGRFSGLFLITLYVLGVFVIGKLGKVKQWHYDIFLLAGLLVCLFGITDYFRLDILKWKSDVHVTQADIFYSTMGNVNTYTAFVALVIGVSSGLFASEKRISRNIWYYVVTAIGFFAIITGQSDNAYLALGTLFALLPLVMFRTKMGVVKYSAVIAAFLSAVKVVDEVNKRMPEQVIGLNGIFQALAGHSHLEGMVLLVWAVVAVLLAACVFSRKRGGKEEVGRWLRILWFCLVGAGCLVILFVLYDANFGGNPEKYGSYASYLVFSDSWGTDRGYCWRIGWESYMELPLVHKLFGFGADTYGILTWNFRQETLEQLGVFYESAHNEYLQYLVTLGPFATLSYILFLGSSCVEIARGMKGTPWAFASVCAVSCYAVQALVNINLPIATPVMWCLLSMGLALSRRTKETEKEEEHRKEEEKSKSR